MPRRDRIARKTKPAEPVAQRVLEPPEASLLDLLDRLLEQRRDGQWRCDARRGRRRSDLRPSGGLLCAADRVLPPDPLDAEAEVAEIAPPAAVRSQAPCEEVRRVKSVESEKPGRHEARSDRAAEGPRRGSDAARIERAFAATPVTAAELRALRREIERKTAPMRWNPETDDVQRSVAQLVLTIVEFLRQLMERQAIRRMEQKTLTPKEVEAVGVALMRLEETIKEIGARFGLTPEDLNLDLGPLGKLM